MQLVKCVVLLCCSFQLVHVVLTIYGDSIDYDVDDDLPMAHHFHHSDPDLRGFERMMLRDMAEDEPEFFNEKESRVRDALLRSTQDMRSQRTLIEMLPILQTLTKPQRLTLSALISTQTNPRSHKSLDFKQVSINLVGFLLFFIFIYFVLMIDLVSFSN